jgi:hypothetical protein
MRSLVYDISNILFRVAAVQKHKSPYGADATIDDLVGLCMHISLQSINKWYVKYKPDFVVFAFEGGDNWRKKYTNDNNYRRQYKANRTVDPEMKHFYQLVDSFREIMTNHTSICCLTVPKMEADDVIAAYCQLNATDDHEIFVVSGDRDFIQLLKLPNVKLINPDDGKLRNQPGDKEYQEDIDYWMFLKCVRGDSGDNVPAAFPRVRETKIREAYKDPYKMMNFLNETWTDEFDVTHRVGDLLKHNEVLMDLTKQPDELRASLLEAVAAQTKSISTYSHFHFLKFLGQFNLKRVGEEASKFIALFTNNQKFLKGEKVKVDTPSVLNEAAPIAKVPLTTKTALLDF